MVDLYEAFRPREGVPPLPVEEIVRRADRRRRRRRGTIAAMGCATLVVAAVLGAALASLPTEIGVVADRPPSLAGSVDDASSAASPMPGPPPLGSTPTVPDASAAQSTMLESAMPSPSADATGAASPATGTEHGSPPRQLVPGSIIEASPDVAVSSTVTSSWSDGYCVALDVVNRSGEPVEWEVRLAPGGTVATHWNAEPVLGVAGILIFTGQEGSNRRLDPGVATTFGLCVDTAP